MVFYMFFLFMLILERWLVIVFLSFICWSFIFLVNFFQFFLSILSIQQFIFFLRNLMFLIGLWQFVGWFFVLVFLVVLMIWISVDVILRLLRNLFLRLCFLCVLGMRFVMFIIFIGISVFLFLYLQFWGFGVYLSFLYGCFVIVQVILMLVFIVVNGQLVMFILMRVVVEKNVDFLMFGFLMRFIFMFFIISLNLLLVFKFFWLKIIIFFFIIFY